MADTKIIHAALFTPGVGGNWGLPIRIIGKPGTAKSSLIVKTAEAAGLTPIVVIASLRDPTDFLGIMIPQEDGTIRYAPPPWALEANNAEHSVVNFDEISSAPPSVQAVLHRVILERVVGDYQLKKTVRFIGAMNAAEDASGAYDFSAALANRFGELGDWQGPSVDEWCAWLSSAGSDEAKVVSVRADVEEARVMQAWPVAYAMAAGLAISFIKSRPNLLHAQPPSGSPAASGAWPSRRTWEMATRAIASSKIHDLSEMEFDRFVGSFIGGAAMAELRAWLMNMDLPDPSELLDGQATFQHNKDRLDRTLAVFASCVALVSPSGAEKRAERAGVLWKMLRDNLDVADIIYPAVTALSRAEVKLVAGYPEARAVLAKFYPIMKMAGLTS